MKKNKLYAAILGDLAGQPYEFPILEHFPPIETINLHNPDSVFSDDTIMTLATAKAILDNQSFEEAYKEVGSKYQGDHYGKDFKEWLNSPIPTQGTSWGNGCIMRIAPIMYLNEYDEEVDDYLDEEERSAKIMSQYDTQKLLIESCMTSHANPISVLACLKLESLYGMSGFFKFNNKEDMRDKLPKDKFTKFAVRADETIDFCADIFVSYDSTHDAIKKVISCGGDTDTNASIVGEYLNYTYQDLTQEDIDYVESKLDPYLLDILHRFNSKTL